MCPTIASAYRCARVGSRGRKKAGRCLWVNLSFPWDVANSDEKGVLYEKEFTCIQRRALFGGSYNLSADA